VTSLPPKCPTNALLLSLALYAHPTYAGLAKARFEAQLVKTNRALLGFAEQVAHDDLLPTHLPGKVKKPKWAKPKKSHGNASARSCTGVEAAEREANKAKQSSRVAGKRLAREATPENSDKDVVVPDTPTRLADESQRGTTIILAM
jgi:hypothetical protein